MTDNDARDDAAGITSPAWNQFLRWAKMNYEAEGFDDAERDYKLVIANNLSEARIQLLTQNGGWVDAMKKAVGTPNNLTNWRFNGPFLQWCEEDKASAETALRTIWDESLPIHDRLDQFVAKTPHEKVNARIAEASFLHMGLDGRTFPIFRATPIVRAYKLTSYPAPESGNNASIGERYEHFLSFLDELMRQAREAGWPLRDRLDAQGIVWAVTSERLPADASAEERAEFTAFLGRLVGPEPKLDEPAEASIVSTGRLPNVSREDLLAAMQQFNLHHRDTEQWREWETQPQYKWAIEHNGRRYPVKEIVSLATGVPKTEFSGGPEANSFVTRRGFEVVRLEARSQPNVWWVNQGKNYQGERDGGLMWAPVKGETGSVFAHWTNMTKVRQGDIVLHYANSALRAVSIVEQPSISASKPDPDRAPWEEDGYLVSTNYHEFSTPILRKDIPAHLRKGEPGGPFTQEGGVNQGYLYPVPVDLLEDLVHRFNVDWPPVVVEITGESRERLVKIAPGPGGSEWEDCLAGGYICVGWDNVGNLLQYDSFGSFLDAFRTSQGDEYQGREPKIREKAQELWTLRELKAGDRIVANRGTSEILGIGIVMEPGYDWVPEREALRHIVHVTWDPDQARRIPTQGYWAFKTVLELQSDFLEKLGDDAGREDYIAPEFSTIADAIGLTGLRISEQTLRRYHLSLATRGFVILAGVSGTGKTWLAEAYAASVGARHALVSVAPNWTTNEDLLGYFNPVTEVYHDTRFSRFLRDASHAYHLARAQGRSPQPYHLVLDEMNLARVEYYFASFLSAMEVRARHGIATLDIGGAEHLEITPNLFVIGTVNIDETTHGFADKVWDRAQLVELDLSRHLVATHLVGKPYRDDVLDIWDTVRNVGPFAFRILDDISTYVDAAAKLGMGWEIALDEQIVQKILPKLKGTNPGVGVALEKLVVLFKDRYPVSHDRSQQMLEGFHQYGFASYFA